MKTMLPTVFALLSLLTLGVGQASGGGPVPADDLPPEQSGPASILCPIVPEEDAGEITSLAFSPDGKTLAAGNVRGMLRLYDPETVRQTASYRVRERVQGGCRVLAFTPDGRAVAAEIAIDKVALLDPATGRRVRVMQSPPVDPHSSGVRAMAVSPDGKSLAGGYSLGEVVIWEVATGRRAHALPPYIIPAHVEGPYNRPVNAHPAGIRALAFAPDGATLFSADADLRAWDVASGKERLRFDKPANPYLSSLALSPDGTVLAAGDHEDARRTITLWDAATGRKRAEMPTGRRVSALAFLPGGKTLVSLEAYNVVCLWDVVTLRRIAALRFDHHCHATCLAVSPDGRRIAAGGFESAPIFGMIELIDTDGVTLTRRPPAEKKKPGADPKPK